jgi:outer membrane receptor protein involved in Fe transport
MTPQALRIVLLSSVISIPMQAIAQQPPASPPPVAAPTISPPANAPASPPQTAAPASPPPATTQVPQVTVQQPPAPKPQPAPVQAEPAKKAPVQQAAPAPAPKPKPVAAKPKPAPAPAPVAPPPAEPEQIVAAEPGSEVKLSPVGGSIPIEKYAGSVSTVTAGDVSRGGEANVQNALQQRVPGVVLTDASGNAFLQEVNFRGFQSSPVNGNAQGLAVYQNGVRINEVFGDTVNWDLVPSNAISELSVITGNPVYGLNAIGGAIAVTMKDGFSFNGTEIDARFGSFGRRQVAVQSGGNIGNLAGYVAFEGIKDDGWRDRSDSTVRRLYSDVGYKDSRQEYHLSFTGGISKLGATAATPIELVNERYGSIFTSPQTIENKLAMLALTGQYALGRTTKLSGNAYVRKYKQRRVDGNITEVTECDPGDPALAGLLCYEENDNTLNGGSIPFDATAFYGSLDRTSLDSTSGGGSVQITETAKLFGLGNQLIVGASLDYGRVTSKGSSELGTIGNDLVVTGNGIILDDDEEDIIKPFRAKIRTEYYGFYIADTLDLTSQLALTLGGRYNIAKIEIKDGGGNAPELAGSHRYERFNPSAGLAYKFAPNASVFGGYSEANRAPTPAELACSDPEKPCLLENFLAADPPLKQVVSHTFEGGLRGYFLVPSTGGKLDWSLVGYSTDNDDDIIAVASPVQGRGYFQNFGKTRRQGIDVSLAYKDGRFSFYTSYGFVDATYQSSGELPAPNNPSAVGCSAEPGEDCVNVRPGDKISSVPQHRFKVGGEYYVTDKWLVGADVVAIGDQFLRGDENNQNAKLSGYATVNLHTSYQITSNLQIYGLVNNLFDEKYSLFGTYFDAGDVTNRSLSDPRTVTPGAPFAAYGGVKLKF